ncbi:sigma-70 family RNA polymerase sigma factor [Telmatocola sphagniphila]|uniref:RNA polymerase sigma factor n=1 Tax=Telmatocola sphagniphila TaxID=1123043 RepID=A0A8E6B6A5_9BACT|nr:sigma-70 family RNA polymerase sigma factor [Telmatocola sphagniphila]QVL32177.1 sigma-70 family RNA polymerase sigma factor [Telmatocola sphagniphila]
MPIGNTSAQMALRDPGIRLMLRVRDDDPLAFGELVEEYQHRVVGVMYHILGDKQEAEDLAQEAFLRVYRNRKKYRPKAKFATWLFTIANNLALNAIRDRKKRHTVPLGPTDSQALNLAPVNRLEQNRHPAPTQNLQHTELTDRIREALNELNERQKIAVILNKFEEMSYEEIGEVMQLSVKAVKSLLSRARAKLREVLQPYIYMDGERAPETGDADEE